MMVQASHEITFIGTGDIGPTHGAADGFPIERYSDLVRDTMAGVDLRFGNCERQYSTRGNISEASPHGRQPPEMARIFSDCRFDAVTLANNHMYDAGPEALIDTRDLMREMGIATTGAGEDLATAREPAIVEKNGVKVALLGYCSVLPQGGMAGPNKIGIAPLRAEAYYDARGAHSAARVVSFPHQGDLDAALSDIAEAKKKADIVMVSVHWGIIWIPRVIADYQITAAHAFIDAGADMVLGHHAHVPKAIEMYKGKAIFYSLSNFCMTKPKAMYTWDEPPWKLGSIRSYTELDPDYPLLPYGKDSKRSLVVKARLSKQGVQQVSFLPMMINTSYQPEFLQKGDERFDDQVRYMEWVSEGFDHSFQVMGDEVLINSASSPAVK
jgi:poly-gamma-glutamate synthesis protein (capsule biosynthesis protein)